MPIDPRIPLMIQPPDIEPPQNAMLRAMQMRGMQQDEQMNSLRLQEHQRKIESENRLREIMSNPGAGFEDQYNALLGTGNYDAAEAVRGRRESAQKTAADFMKNVPKMLSNVPPEQRAGAYKAMLQHGVGTGLDISLIPSDLTPEFESLIEAAGQPTEYQQRQLGLSERRAAATEASANGAVSSQVDDEGNVTHFDRQGKIVAVTPKAGKSKVPRVPTYKTVTDAAGNVTVLDETGSPVKKIEGAGKPSATFEKNRSERIKMTRDLDRVIPELEEATKDGGLIDQSTGSGAGAAMDAVAGFVGHATDGSIAVGKLQPIYDLVLKMVPRFEGPQSDKDTQSYREAAGELANPNVPNARKKAAAKEILRLMKNRKGQFVTQDMIETPDATAPPSPDGEWGIVRD